MIFINFYPKSWILSIQSKYASYNPESLPSLVGEISLDKETQKEKVLVDFLSQNQRGGNPSHKLAGRNMIVIKYTGKL